MLVGREAEQAAIASLLDAARSSRGAALVVRGEPGIGKTALLEDAGARAADTHVLRARGVESESELPFAGLYQLIRPALHLLERLPNPQSSALQGALGLTERSGDDRFLISAACLTLLSELGERQAVLCLVDDAHWLDAPSADVLLFVCRRLEAEPIVILFGARAGDIRTFQAADVPSLELAGLDADAAETLVSSVAGVVTPAVRARLVEQARGNALALLELPSALNEAQLAGVEPLPAALPVTEQMDRVFLERVRRLPEETQRALVVAAADDSEDAAIVLRAAEELGLGAHALDAAEQAGLVVVHGTRLEFRHPLVRSAAYAAVTSSERRAAHGALSRAMAGHDEHADGRAWHLAASALEHDETAVQALERAAERAEERAAHAAAARAYARAAELSADAAGRGRRLALAARAASIAGADDLAVSLATQAGRLVDDPVLEAEIARAIGAADVRRGRPYDSFPRLIAAVERVASLDVEKAVELLVWATAAAHTGGQFGARELSGAAKIVLAAGGDDDLMHLVRALTATARTMEGDPPGPDELEDAFAWASTYDAAEYVFPVSVAFALRGDDEHFVPLLERAVTLARSRGELGVLAEALGARATWHALQHRFDAATREATESAQFARDLGAPNVVASSLSILALVAAHRGDDEEVRRNANEVLELAAAHGLGPRASLSRYALAMLDLGRGRWLESVERLQAIVHPTDGDALVGKWALPDFVEAAMRAGRHDEARSALGELELWADPGPPWAPMRLAACRALLAEEDDATAYYLQALDFGPGTRPFDYARIQLLFGEHLRRHRRRTDSRVQLRAALETFERFRTEPWAERARTELRASGETARKRDPSTIAQLTPQELQIAGFVAEGLSNKEVAAQLFLSPRTIDYHLRNVFAKLDITSRTQLARLALDEVGSVQMSVSAPA